MRIRKLDVAKLPTIQEGCEYPCCLYVVQEEKSEHFKIGVAQHPRRRLSSMRCGNSRMLYLMLAYEGPRSACLAAERATLKYFSAPKDSEWVFAHRLSDIERYIDSLIDEGAP